MWTGKEDMCVGERLCVEEGEKRDRAVEMSSIVGQGVTVKGEEAVTAVNIQDRRCFLPWVTVTILRRLNCVQF